MSYFLRKKDNSIKEGDRVLTYYNEKLKLNKLRETFVEKIIKANSNSIVETSISKGTGIAWYFKPKLNLICESIKKKFGYDTEIFGDL